MIIVMGWFSSSLVFSLVLHICDLGYAASLIQDSYVSAIGDPGMKNPNARFAFEAWNFCNEVGSEAPHMGSIWGAPGLLTVLIFMGSLWGAPGLLTVLIFTALLLSQVVSCSTIKTAFLSCPCVFNVFMHRVSGQDA